MSLSLNVGSARTLYQQALSAEKGAYMKLANDICGEIKTAIANRRSFLEVDADLLLKSLRASPGVRFDNLSSLQVAEAIKPLLVTEGFNVSVSVTKKPSGVNESEYILEISGWA